MPSYFIVGPRHRPPHRPHHPRHRPRNLSDSYFDYSTDRFSTLLNTFLGMPPTHPATSDPSLFGAGGGGVRDASLNPAPLPSALEAPHPNRHPLRHGIKKGQGVSGASGGDGAGGVGGAAGGAGSGGEGGGDGDADAHPQLDGATAGGGVGAGDGDEEARAREALAWAESEVKKTLDYGATGLKGPMVAFEKTIGDGEGPYSRTPVPG